MSISRFFCPRSVTGACRFLDLIVFSPFSFVFTKLGQWTGNAVAK